MTILRWFLLLCVFGLGCQAWACSCIVGDTGCRKTMPLDGTLFLGKVLRLDYEGGSPTIKEGINVIRAAKRIYTITITEAFSGGVHVGEEVKVYTGPGDCEYKFIIGERYFVSAEGPRDNLETSVCSATSLEADAALVLRMMRAIGSRLPDLSGLVVRRNPDRDNPQAKALSGVAVTATSADGTIYRAVTESDGVYQIATMPAGVYTMHFDLPPKLIERSYEQQPRTITIPPASGGGAGCNVNVNAYPTGRISGQVVDAQGRGISGSVYVFRTAPPQKRPINWVTSSTVGQDGSFELFPLAAGTYWLQFILHNDVKRFIYFPGTTDQAAAQPITVEDGEATAPFRVVVAP